MYIHFGIYIIHTHTHVYVAARLPDLFLFFLFSSTLCGFRRNNNNNNKSCTTRHIHEYNIEVHLNARS